MADDSPRDATVRTTNQSISKHCVITTGPSLLEEVRKEAEGKIGSSGGSKSSTAVREMEENDDVTGEGKTDSPKECELAPAKQDIEDIDGGEAGEKTDGPREHETLPATLDATTLHNEHEEGDDDDGGEEEQRGEPFVTYKPKIIQLCHDIGYGEPLEVEELEGGSYHRVISLKFAPLTTPDCILRIPWFTYNEDQPHELIDQISVLRYLSIWGHRFLRIASILAYDTTTANAIESQYTVQTRLPGKSMDPHYYELSLQEKLALTTHIAKLTIKMESITFEKPGRIVGDRSLPPLSHTAPDEDDYVVTDVIGYHAQLYTDMPSMEEQPLLQWLQTLIQFRAVEFGWLSMNLMCRKLMRIAGQMQRAGFFRLTDNKNVLWHWDFAARNVLIAPMRDTSSIPSLHTSDYEKSILEDSDAGSNIEKNDFPESITSEDAISASAVEKDETRESTTSDEPDSTSIVDKNYSSKSDTSINIEIPLPVGRKPGQWEITGVVDWDNVLSVPLIIARRPPAWLWFNEEERGCWDGQNDAKPPRDLTGDELVIKAHFDQIMSNASPTYI